jgi:hypothetical protein
MNELAQKVDESPRSWLTRLGQMDSAALSLAQQRALAGYLAYARRLVQEEEQKVKWDRGRRY